VQTQLEDDHQKTSQKLTAIKQELVEDHSSLQQLQLSNL